MSTQRALTAIALLAVLLVGCESGPTPEPPREYLDSATAATVTVVGKPIVFFHEHPELAVHMRDYITMAAAAVDRQGKTDYVLIAYFWTTLDAHGKTATEAEPAVSAHSTASAPDKVILAADDRRIELTLMAHTAHEAGVGERIHAPPGHSFSVGVYRTDLPTLRFVAATRHLELLPTANDSELRYALWDDERRALDSFVQHASEAP